VLVTRTLRRAGWRVVRIWECALQKRPQSCIQKIEQCLNPKV
jgi:G:T-mismatch repair DNA endonuclease (very short patch repair protein)